MNARQAAFVREYMVDGIASQAAIRAGYSPNGAGTMALRLLKNADIQLAIAEAENQAAHRNDLTVDLVLSLLRENYARAMDQTRPDIAAANKAAELLGKHIGMWPRTPDNVQIDARTQILTLGAGTLPLAALRALAAMKLPEEEAATDE